MIKGDVMQNIWWKQNNSVPFKSDDFENSSVYGLCTWLGFQFNSLSTVYWPVSFSDLAGIMTQIQKRTTTGQNGWICSYRLRPCREHLAKHSLLIGQSLTKFLARIVTGNVPLGKNISSFISMDLFADAISFHRWAQVDTMRKIIISSYMHQTKRTANQYIHLW